MQGYRTEMEDQHIHEKMPGAPDHLFLGVFDGHGGKGCAIYVAGNDPDPECKKNSLVNIVARQQEWLDYLKTNSIDSLETALTKAFIEMDVVMQGYCQSNPAKAYHFGGCTAVTVMITPEWIICANAGDSRATMCHKNGTQITLSKDHKPDNPIEKERIEKAGGQVHNKRVDGSLAVSRGFGDFEFKLDKEKPADQQKVSCVPEIMKEKRSPQEEMIILACDGLWDVFSNDEAINEVRKIWQEGEDDIQLVAEEMLDRSLEKRSEDNISAIVVKLAQAEIAPSGDGVIGRRESRLPEAQNVPQEFSTYGDGGK